MTMKKSSILTVFTLLVVSGASASQIEIDLATETGENLDNFDLELEGPEEDQIEDIDSFDRNLEQGEYTFSATKQDYKDIEREIDVQEDLDASYIFVTEPEDEETEDGNLEITGIESPENVCQSKTFVTDFDILNRGNESRVVSASGFGFGKILSGKSFVVGPKQTKTYRFRFTGLRETGTQQFTVSASGIDSDSQTGNVTVFECQTIGDPDSVTDIELNLYPTDDQQNPLKNEVVRIKGFADGGRGSMKLNLSVNGEKKREIRTQRDGYFQTYTRFTEVGTKTVSVSTTKVSGSSEIEVLPKPSIEITSFNQEPFLNEEFDICVDVESSIAPLVVLSRDKNVIRTVRQQGNFCFSVKANNAGKSNYTVRALTYGEDSSSSRIIDVTKPQPEVETFPDQITSVESDDSLVRVSLYNDNDNTKNYTVSIDNLEKEWISKSSKKVSLESAEEDTLYFYISPLKTGRFEANLTVELGKDIIYSDDLEVYSTEARYQNITAANLLRVVSFITNLTLFLAL
ncbi:hypothetical protein GLU60_03510 [Nanohaloarchaea archaeon H01]|nr:hypothetical protein [Nanohaloarchaea archaeon H01]